MLWYEWICVPKDTSDIFADTSEQRSEGEYYVGSVTNVPLWLTGPGPLQEYVNVLLVAVPPVNCRVTVITMVHME